MTGRCGRLVLDQALRVAVERDDADRLRCRNSKANCIIYDWNDE
jgi:hypothetical protein